LAAPGVDQPGLVLVSTPIGNLGDMTIRGLAVLRAAGLVLCEDTRVTAHLLRHFGISCRTLALHDHNEDSRIPEVLRELAGGATVALVSDAGTPLVSDPGYRLVRAALEAGLRVTAAPGANAAVMALTLSGLPPHPYLFLGFPPPKAAARQACFARLRAAERAGLGATLVMYESPHRAGETLADLAACFGARPAALTRELTKRFEEVVRGSLPELAARFSAEEPRGEVTLVVGPPADEAVERADLDSLLIAAMRTESVREAAAGVAAATGMARRVVYARALELRQGGNMAPDAAKPLPADPSERV
jgi:16S rRNA (cytidine1402-2'-O)-methyltransferase